MTLFSHHIIRKKLMLLLVLTSCSVLSLATIGFAVSDWINSRAEVINHLDSQANIIGNNSVASLLFNDVQSATETLRTLEGEENIIGAYLYNHEKALFAHFQRGSNKQPIQHLPDKPNKTMQEALFVVHTIRLDNETVGHILLLSELDSWQAQQLERLQVVFLLFVFAFIVAIFISNAAQRIITQPILKLANTARTITKTQDYHLRAEKQSEDEVGALADDFNEMLKQIQHRDDELQQARNQLEGKVKERTSELYKLTKQLEHQAFHDPLTGLANRATLDENLQGAINFAQRHNQQLAVFFLDLDRFKGINDSLGHDVGDKLLVELGQRLKNALRSSDILARLGGDEFAVLLQDTQPHMAAEVASKLIDAIGEPIVVDEYNLQVTTSIGISIYPEDGKSAAEILKRADTAMYSSKEAGRNQFSFFANEMNIKTERRMLLEHKLRQAAKDNNFKVYYQPKWDAQEHKIIGLEALIRWFDPEEGFISPAEFIPLAEDCGLIGIIDQWVMKTACSELLALYAGAPPQVLLSVNFSPAHFIRQDICERITDLLEETGYPGNRLELEITETVVASEGDSIYEQLNSIRQLGIEISIDDFGIAYSSLSRLKQLPLNTLKIDRSFIHDIGSDPDDEVIVRTIIDMAHNLNLKVVAEGVENEAQYAFVREHRCDAVQGFLFSKPVPIQDLEPLLNLTTIEPK